MKPMVVDNASYKVAQPTSGKELLIIGLVGLALCGLAALKQPKNLMFSYLSAYAFWWTLALGGFFFTMLHHLTGARWSVVLRRFAENLMMNLPIMVIFVVPILIGVHLLYPWSHADHVAQDTMLQAKSAYLNVPFFVVRALLYFAIWYLFAGKLYQWSLKQDASADLSLLARMRRLSAPGMILFALTLTFAAIDWLMSLDPHWFSTMFGVYIFAGSVLSGLAMITLFVLWAQRRGLLKQEITAEHYHDLGKLMFAFTVFWAYIAFSQYMLIWYANIPEETLWFKHRWDGSWRLVSLTIVIGHFVVPFLVLLARAPKRNKFVLVAISVWILIVHAVDMVWLVMPNLYPHGAHLGWPDAAAFVGIGGVFCWLLRRRFLSAALLPRNDPYLEESLHHEL